MDREVDREGQSNISGNVITFDNLDRLCAQVAASFQLGPDDDHQPTAREIVFFTMVWIAKKTTKAKKDEEDVLCAWDKKYVVGLHTEKVRQHAELVATHLASNTAIVKNLRSPRRIARQESHPQIAFSGLEESNHKEWELLRLQMENAVRRYACPKEMKDDALQDSLAKILGILNKMANMAIWEQPPHPFDWIAENQDLISNIYDFRVPVYAWAKTIVRNELMSLLRRGQHEPIDDDLLEEAQVTAYDATDDAAGTFSVEVESKDPQAEFWTTLYTSQLEPTDPAVINEQIYEAARLQVRIDLSRLLALLQEELPPKQKGVVYYTLAARSQFWNALHITELSAPADMPPGNEQATDEVIAEALKMSVNSVRVNRNHAKKHIGQCDSLLGYWLNELMLDPNKHMGQGRSQLLMLLTRLRDQNWDMDDPEAA